MEPINHESPRPRTTAPSDAGRRAWTPPSVEDLPKLTDLTLLTGSPIPGTGGTGGTTVF